MGNKRNASIGMAYLYTMLVITAILVLSSCTSRSQRNAEQKVKEYQDVRSIMVVDINGDTVRITGGATCHLDKKISKK